MSKKNITLMVFAAILAWASGMAGNSFLNKETTLLAAEYSNQQQTSNQSQAPGAGSTQYSLEQAMSDNAQLSTIAFSGLAFITGSSGADTFMPPGKVADFFGFQYMRDVDTAGYGHNTTFLSRVANNVLYILNDEQKAKLVALAKEQAPLYVNFAYNRFSIMNAFRRNLSGDIPTGSTGLNIQAVSTYTGGLYKTDADLSYNRAVVVGGIITSFTDEQKAYLAKMEFNNYLSWPDVAEDESIKKGLTDNEFVAVMTYASELFSWYKGNLDADVYFCPERHGTYFGGFYMKDYPAMNNPDYFISTEVTGDSGQGFLNALNTEQKALVIGIIEEQRAALTEIAQVRTTVSTELRKAISGGTIDKALVYSLIERYGELDGQMSALYASRFSAVKKTLTDAQMATLIELRNLDVVPLGAYRFSTPIAMPVISNTDFMFGVGDLPTNAGQTTAPESFGSTNMVSLTIAPTSPSTFGQTVTFTAKLNPTSATGTVVFWDSANGLNLSAAQIISGVATFTTSELSVGNHTFSATYSDNKSDAGSFSNSITYTVYALLVVSVGEDNGKGDTAGTFSYALLQSQALSSNTTISFTTKNVTFTSSLSLTIPAGVRIDGGSTCTQPPAVIINGNGANGDGLVLNGNNFLRNVWIKGFSNRQITTSTLTALWKKNTLQCVKLSR